MLQALQDSDSFIFVTSQLRDGIWKLAFHGFVLETEGLCISYRTLIATCHWILIVEDH